MKCLKKIQISLLALSMMVLASGRTAFAEDGYTYTVRLLAGKQGTLTGQGIDLGEAPGAVQTNITDSEGNIIGVEISGLTYDENKEKNSRISIAASDAAKEKDERYYVRGVKRAGRDNSEEEPSFEVDCDKDYVISYGVRGDTVQYTVNYVDADGNALLTGGTYYGNSGERQYVSARYVDGYQPQAYNLVKTLSDNEAENVFNFIYTPVPGPVAETTTEPGTGTETATPAAPAAPAAPGAAAAPAAPGAAAATPEGGEVVPVEDEETPQDLVDLDDEETPLANQKLEDTERPGGVRMGYLPLYAGIGAAAAAALLLAAIYLNKRRKSAEGTITDSQGMSEDIKNIKDDE